MKKMKKSILSVALCMLATLTMTAQSVDKAKVTTNADAAAKAGEDLKKLENAEKAWKFDGTVGLNAAATGLVNWAAGGKNNVNGIVYAKLHLLYHKNAFAWETNFDTDFGMTWIEQKEDAFQKSSDNIKLATKLGWEFKTNWYLTVLGSFQSQYALGREYLDGYNPIGSKWLAPSYTDFSIGIDWKKSYKGADFSIYLSPVAGRVTTAYIGENWNKRYTREAALGTYQHAIDYADNPADKAAAQAAYDAAAEAYDNNYPFDGYDFYCQSHNDLRSRLQEKYGTSIAPFHVAIREGEKFVGFVNVVSMKGRKFAGAKYEDCDIPADLEDEVSTSREALMEAVAETSEEFMETPVTTNGRTTTVTSVILMWIGMWRSVISSSSVCK